ncbi:MAG: hypothetical protein HW387_1270 [Parachlamydiales bacterium]|nr:hypothetical protein [Parachlamydiales bacterium]
MKRSVCLNMIVKDESPVIQRCLASVKHLIDYWVIVDTGSSDGTQDIVRETMRDIPGELHERPWVDFSHNRNEALQLAKTHADYILFLDADQYLVLSGGASLSPREADVYYCAIRTDAETFYHELMVATRLDWKWIGTIHEGLICPEAKSSKVFTDISIVATEEGNRSRSGKKYLSDAVLLEKELEKDPASARNVFYLALSYALGGEPAKALVQYEKRVSMGGDPEEAFAAQLSLSEVQEMMKYHPDIFLQSYEKAYLMRPTRSEPLFAMARYFLNAKNYFLAYLISQFALTIPYPDDKEYIRYSVYDYELLMQWAESSYALGKIDEACSAYQKLIEKFEKMVTQNEVSLALRGKIAEILPGMRQFVFEN